MPHVIVSGKVSVEQFVQDFQEEVIKGPEIIRFLDAFLNAERTKALVEVVVVEAGHSRRFYVDLDQKSDGVSVHVEPLTDVEKTEAVKTAIALLGKRLVSQNAANQITRTNLSEYLQ